jgi:hypothetical protein
MDLSAASPVCNINWARETDTTSTSIGPDLFPLFGRAVATQRSRVGR